MYPSVSFAIAIIFINFADREHFTTLQNLSVLIEFQQKKVVIFSI